MMQANVSPTFPPATIGYNISKIIIAQRVLVLLGIKPVNSADLGNKSVYLPRVFRRQKGQCCPNARKFLPTYWQQLYSEIKKRIFNTKRSRGKPWVLYSYKTLVLQHLNPGYTVAS